MIPYDVVFLIDDTGSMKNYINQIKSNITSLVTSLKDNDVDFRFGIVQYGDIADSAIKQYDFTADINEFVNNLSSVSSINKSGGDGPESGLEAIMSALSMNFREDANKYFIVVTDDSFHNKGETGDGNPDEYLNKFDVIKALKNANVQMDVIGASGGSIQKAWESIIANTNGQFYDMTGNFSTIFKSITGDVQIPSDAFVYNGHSYYLFNTDTTWAEAKEMCEKIGGHLVTITDGNEQKAIETLMHQSNLEYNGYWLGGFENNSVWQWVTGENFSYSHFSQDEPNNSGSYLQIYADDYTSFNAEPNKWDDTTLDATGNADIRHHGFICEWDISKSSGRISTDTVSTETSHISYDNLTPEQLQQLQEKSIRSLIELVDSFEEMDIAPLTFEECDNDPQIYAESEKFTKLANCLAKLRKQAKSESNVDIPFSMIMDINDIVDSAKDIKDDSKSDNEKNSAKLKIGEKCFSIVDTVSDWKGLETLKSTEIGGRVFGMPFSLISSVFGFASNIVAAQDGIDNEKRRELEESFVDLSGAVVSFAAEKIGENIIEQVVEVAANRIIQASTEELLTLAGRQLIANSVEEAVKSSLAGKFNSAITSSIVNSVKEATQTAMQQNYNQILAGSFNTLYSDSVKKLATQALTKKLDTLFSPFGPINAGIAIITGVVAGVDQYNISKAQYIEDKIPTAKRDAIIDAAATGIYEAIHKYTFGADDLIVQLGVWIGTKLTGQDYFYIDDYADNWVDLMARGIKYDFLHEWEGTDKDDAMISSKDGEMLYGGYGNDSIANFHSNMKIYGGADCDTVISNASNYRRDYGATSPTSGTHNNYIDLGRGDDSIAMHDYSSTVRGGSGNDTLIVVGDDIENPTYGNIIYGEAGNDNIRVTNVDKSTINGGAGNDYILLRKVNNSTVNGGSGDDYIEFQGSDNNVIEYGRAIGNDVIVGYNSSDSIIFGRLINGESYDTITSDNDLVIYVGNESITLKDANGQQLNIKSNYIPSKEDLSMKNLIAQKQQIMGDLSVVRSLGGNLRLRAGADEISVEDIRDNFIDVKNDEGNTTAQVYMSRESGGEVAGNALGDSPNIFKVIIGASENQNQLIAGSGGASMFGGKTDDILQGGVGQDYFSYESGNDTIDNYDSWEDITFSGTYQNWMTDGNDLVINAAEGSLRITDAKDKLVELKSPNGNILAHICISSDEGTFDGSTYNEYVVVVGADNKRNQLIAGSGGSSLWGGAGKTFDTMYGGAGANEFIYNYGNGHDAIFNADYQDTVNLSGVTFNQILGSRFIPNRATFMFTDYGSLNVSGEAGNFIIDGQNFRADYANNQLKEK